MSKNYKLIKEPNDGCVQKIKRITRPTFLRYVDKMDLGDVEESLGYSAHHKIGETITKNAKVTYFKAVLVDDTDGVRKNMVFMIVDGQSFYFSSQKRIKSTTKGTERDLDALSESEIISLITEEMVKWDKEKLKSHFLSIKNGN